MSGGVAPSFLFGPAFLLEGTSLVLWLLLSIFLVANLIWLVEVLVQLLRTSPTSGPRHGPDEMQVRVLTIDATEVVQQTVDAMPTALEDRHVIAEEPMEIDGATVHVVPNSFDCEATRKGRALEWARRNVPCEKEYVLFVDEDSIISDIPPIPDADVVQFSECPTRTESLFTYLAELFRMGFQIEQRAFSSMSIPLYAWGGGLAIRRDLEDRITWDHETIIEDTVFVWKAAQNGDFEFEAVPTKFYNQAPPTISAMIQQRRRWISGAIADLQLLPRRYRYLFRVRNIGWSLSPIAIVFALVAFTQGEVLFNSHFLRLSVLLTVFLYTWSILGVWYADESLSTGISLLLLTPLISILHSIGALVGFAFETSEFETTKKINPSDTPSVSVSQEHDD